MPIELPYAQWIIVAKDLLNKPVTILKAPWENQQGLVIDIWADGNNPRTINCEMPDGTLQMLMSNEYKKI